jgi:hypothetical protein
MGVKDLIAKMEELSKSGGQTSTSGGSPLSVSAATDTAESKDDQSKALPDHARDPSTANGQIESSNALGCNSSSHPEAERAASSAEPAQQEVKAEAASSSASPPAQNGTAKLQTPEDAEKKAKKARSLRLLLCK